MCYLYIVHFYSAWLDQNLFMVPQFSFRIVKSKTQAIQEARKAQGEAREQVVTLSLGVYY